MITQAMGAPGILPLPEEDFPRELWQRMGETGLLGVACGDHGDMPLLSLSLGGKIVAQTTRDMGLTLLWLIHGLASRLIVSLGTDPQRQRYLPRLKRGITTACFAVSEPGTGPHPKHLKTNATADGDHYILNGEKTWVTNAPNADLFITIAITDIHEGKKRYSAFIVPRETPGVTVSAPFDMPFFKTAPHGSIQLNQVRIPRENMLGAPDTAYEHIVIPFSNRENGMMMGPVTGGFEAQRHMILKAASKKDVLSQEFHTEIAKSDAMIHAASMTAIQASLITDTPDADRELLFKLIFFRDLGKEIHLQLKKLCDLADLTLDPAFERLATDLTCAGMLGEKNMTVKQIQLGKQLVETYMAETDSPTRQPLY